MTKNKTIGLSLILVVVVAHGRLSAQEITVQGKQEILLHYSLQRPFYSVNNPMDILALPQDWRMRSALGVEARHYFFEKWYISANLGYSQEGGGYSRQHTNANYFKTGLYLGYSARHYRKLIFTFYTGYEHSLLLTARFIDENNTSAKRVQDYISPSYGAVPLGIGLKKKIGQRLFTTLDVSAHIGSYYGSTQSFLKSAQIILPAFRIGFSKFLTHE
jgi:hypothetical protein